MKPSSPAPATLPLSPVQTGMVLPGMMRPAAGLYIQQFRVRFRRLVNSDVLRMAWNCLLERHDSLRASLCLSDPGNPAQRIADVAKIPFQFEDWSDLRAVVQKRRLQKYLRDDRARGFELQKAPLMRIALFRHGPTESEMVWTSHHLLFDGRSRYILLRELAVACQALETGRSLDLPPAPSFATFISWVHANDFSEAQSYWRSALAGVIESTPCGFATNRKLQSDLEARRLHATWLPSAVLEKLDRFAARQGLTANTLLQAAWAVVLSRYSRQENVVFAAPRAGRNCPVADIHAMVGVFVNTLPVCVRVNDAIPILEFLRGIRENWVAMRPYEQTPLREIRRWCQVPDGVPLFQSLIGFENFQLAEQLAANDSWWSGASVDLEGWTDFALTIQAYRGSRLELRFTYDPAQFTSGAIRRLGGHVRTVLDGIVSARTRCVGDLRLLTNPERRLLRTWSETSTSYRPSGDVGSAFSRVAHSSPDAIALTHEGRDMSYGELDSASRAVSAYLQARGYGRGDRIGVLAARSFEQIVAILGILKAGAAYVPLDPEYPRERLRFMIGDAALRLVLGTGGTRAALDGIPVEFKTVADAREEGRADSAGWQPPEADPNAAAYVMYTSGSTGAPKGVVVPHRGILRLVFGADYVELGPERIFLHMAPASFDASTFELWGALLHGARCVLYPFLQVQLREVARLIEVHRVDTLWLTAALFNFIIDEAPEILRPVRQLLTGGEALSPAHVARALVVLPATLVINGYGPTETTTFACCHAISPGNVESGEPVPIGRPIGNTSVHVLDCLMRPVPVGIEGELFIGGAGVASGYLNRPALTAERFVQDPDGKSPEDRLYRTGDLVCWREDGLLEFRGRTDDQLKIRGHRIEPGEIARVLQEHPAVKQAAVLAVEKPSSGKVLVAFYTTESDAAMPAPGLVSFIAERLPAYLIPGSFVRVDRVPITANGKVDREALMQFAPDLDAHERTSDDAPASTDRSASPDVIARSDKEAEVLQIFREVLKRPDAGPHDSFFLLGGHSLLATLVLHRIERALGTSVGYCTLFENPTARKLAAALSNPKNTDNGPPLAALIHRPANGRHRANLYTKNEIRFLVSGQARNITRSFFLRGPLRLDALERALQWVVDRHDALRMRLIDTGHGGFEREVHPVRVELFLEAIGGSTRTDQLAEAEKRMIAEAGRVFGVSSFPFHRFTLLRLSDVEHVLVLTIHHIFFDGKSLPVLLRQISVAYQAFIRGESPTVPAPAFQFDDVMLWMEEWLDHGALDTLEDYWKQRVGNLTPTLLPADLTPVSDGGIAGEIVHHGLGTELTAKARQTAMSLGTTYHGLTHAVSNVMLRSFGNLGDVDVGVMCCMRRHPAAEEVIGNFANFVVARTDMAGNPSFRDIVRRTRRSALDALDHRGLPFPRLRALAPPVKSSNGNPFRFYLVEESSMDGLLQLPHIETEVISRRTFMPSVMLIFQITNHPTETTIRCLARPEYFSPGRVREIIEQFEYILRLVVDDPDRRLDQFPLFAP